jgi:hypothetical protein
MRSAIPANCGLNPDFGANPNFPPNLVKPPFAPNFPDLLDSTAKIKFQNMAGLPC